MTMKSGIPKFLKTYEWPIVWILAVVAFCLGLIGFRQHFPQLTQLDIVYLAFQLFTLESGAPPGTIGIILNIARFLAPAVTVYAAAKALAVIFQRQLQMVRLKTMHGHVVIAGLGRSGMLFAEAFRKQGLPVVVVERNETNEQILNCHDTGALTVIGDARAADILSRAGVNRAKVLICVTGEDGTNAEIAVQAKGLLSTEQRQPLTSLVHIVDAQLCRLLRKQELMGTNNHAMRMEFFNIYESAVRDLFAHHPPFQQNQSSNFLIIGLGQMGESLLLALTRAWMQQASKPSPRFTVVVLDRSANRKVEALQVRYPYLIQNCIVTPLEIEVPSTEFYQRVFLKMSGLAAVYLTLDHDAVCLSTALLLRQWINGTTPIFVRMAHQGGLSTLLSQRSEGKTEAWNIIPFGAAQRVCNSDLLAGSTKEILARVIHEEYVKAQLHQQSSAQTNPALASWDDLPEWLKESNRTQADHIGEKLRRIRCDLVLFSDEKAESFQFDQKEIEALSRMEHERWMEERTKDGWKYAAGEKNVELKTNPYLVSYDELPEQIKEYNRKTVRELPRFLVRAGYQIYRI